MGWDNAPIWETIRLLDGVSDSAKAKILGGNAAERLFRTAEQREEFVRTSPPPR